MIRPLRDRIYAIPLEDPDKSPGGLWIPPQAKQRADQGIVKYRGADIKDVRVGDHIIFSGYTGTHANIQGEGLLYVMRERDVVAIIEDGDHHVFTLEQINNMIDRTMGNMLMLQHDRKLIEEFSEHFRSFFNDHLMAEMQF